MKTECFLNTVCLRRMWKSYLAKTTFRRLYNALRIWLSYQYSKFRRKPFVWGAPIAVSIEPTTACNLRCPECPSGQRSFTRPTGNMKWPLFQQLVDDLAPRLTAITFYFQGEPFIHPQFLEMVRYANRKNLVTITSTNGHFIDTHSAENIVQSGLDKLILSIDGLSQQTYAAYRVGGDLQKVLHAAECLSQAKKKFNRSRPFVVFQFLAFRHNEHEIPALRALAKKYNADDVQIKTAQVYDYRLGNSLIPENEVYSRYSKGADGIYRIKNPMHNHCWRLWHSSVITWDGKVVPCCFDKDANHVMGDLSGGLLPVWRGSHYQKFRQMILYARKSVDICTNCTEGLSVFEKV